MIKVLISQLAIASALTAFAATLSAVFVSKSFAMDGANGPGVDNTARPAGTKLKYVPLGGRMVTFHRGYLYIMGQGKTTLWDVSDAENPKVLTSKNYGDNGHRWWKLNTDMFWREYSNPEILGSGYHFIDMSNMLDLKPWTNPSAPVPIAEGGEGLLKWQLLETHPTGTSGGNIHDIRFDDPAVNQDAITSTFNMSGSEGSLRFRIGNLFFSTTGTGMSVLDIGDPKNVKLLDTFNNPGFQQYTTTYHVWRDKIIFLNGNNGNLNGNNMAMLDFSDPTNLKPYVWPSGATGLTTEQMSSGRYMYFQDEFGFAGQNDLAVKINMETGEVVQKFIAPGWPETFLDYQWMPLGPTLVGTGSNGDDGRSFFYQHQDGPDIRGPEVGFHSPAANSINNPVSTVIGFSIPEIIDERTANDQTIQVRAVGSGVPVKGDITWNSYHVLNFIPKTFLEADTTYEVKFVEGGLKDVAGNGIKETIFYFSTGAIVNANAAPTITSVDIAGMPDNAPAAVNSVLTFTAMATDPEADPLEYRWDFGTGNSAWSTVSSTSTSFAKSGIYTVKLQVRDSQGGLATSTRTVVVSDVNTAGGMATRSGALALDATARILVAANPDNNTVTKIDPDTLKVVAEWASCEGPTNVAIDINSHAWVTCRDADKLQVFNAKTGVLVKTITLDYGDQPVSAVAHPDGKTVYIANTGSGQVLAFDAATKAQVAALDLGPDARAMAIDAAGKSLLVTQFISGSTGTIWRVDLASFSLNGHFSLANDTTTPDGGNAAGGLPNYLAGVAVSPVGDKALVAGKKDNTDRGTFFGTEPLTFEFTSRSNISTLDLAAGTENQLARLDIDNHSQPSSVAFSPYGSHVLLTMQGNNRLIILDARNGAEVARVDTGLAPQDVIVDPQTNRIFVKNFMGRSVSIFDGKPLLIGGGSVVSKLAELNTVSRELLSAQVLAGKQLFYNAADPRMTLEGYLSCATCHDDAGHDGRTWDFTARGEGLRNTIALKGRAGTAHGRVHWSANFDEIHDFENDIRNGFRGTGFMSDANFALTADTLGIKKAGKSTSLDALSAYHESLNTFARSPYRTATGELSIEGQAGKLVFASAGCATCHGGEGFTDSPSGVRHDVGTIGIASGTRRGDNLLGIDTPTLRDLWSSSPYLHDGSAATLADVFAKGSGHSFTGISAADKESLEAYLLQLDGSELAPATPVVPIAITSLKNGDTLKSKSIPLAVSHHLSGVQAVNYYANGKKIASSTLAPYSGAWQPTATGDYVIQAQAVYNAGNTATLSADVAVTVAPSGACNITYKLLDTWAEGYRVELVVMNEAAVKVEGVRVEFDLVAGESFDTGWNATFTSTLNRVVATNAAGKWNGDLAANGGTATIGYQANKPVGVAPMKPKEIWLNGDSCEIK